MSPLKPNAEIKRGIKNFINYRSQSWPIVLLGIANRNNSLIGFEDPILNASNVFHGA